MADPNIGVTHVKINYTFDEAIEYMKMLDKLPTTQPISWKYSNSGKSVTIGYTGV